MKSKRLSKILEIIEQYNIETQEELLDKLSESGFAVTQATISRDINELRLTKVMTSEGKYKYARYVSKNESAPAFNYRSILSESIISVDRAMNMIVIKTYPGMAQGVAAAVDAMGHIEVVGSLAGDDTIFLAMRSVDSAAAYSDELSRFLRK